MNNFRIPTTIRLIIGGVIVLMLGGLAGWYFYLHSAESSSSALSTARGLGVAAPSFEGTAGSTQANQAIAAQIFDTAPAGSSGTSSSELWEVDRSPVAGMGFVTSETDEHLYYVERGNGYVFSAHPSTDETVRVTDTLMPKIYEALFADDGSVIERSIDTSGNITTFLGTISTSSVSITASSTNVARTQAATVATDTPATLAGLYLPTGIRDIALDRVSKSLFYTTVEPQGGIDGTTVGWDGTKKKQVFTSIVGSWRPMLLDDGRMILLESPADGIPGYAYTLGATGTLTPLVRDVEGLTILPKSASPLFIYGSSSGTGLSLFANVGSTTSSIGLSTVAEKCVWLPGSSEIVYCAVPNTAPVADYLDNWYQGTTNTSDDWWEIDLSTGTTKRIYSPSADNVSLDVENPTIDQSGNYIAFQNATDQSLWVLRVAQ
jgi:hypothetical protein